MRIAYITDQILPQHSTDTEQIVSMVAAFGSQGADVRLLVPTPWRQQSPILGTLTSYYQVEPSFTIVPIRSVYPSLRGLEKIAHGVASMRQVATWDADVIYSRNLPIVVSALRWTNWTNWTNWTKPLVVYETYRPWPGQHPRLAAFFRWLGAQRRFKCLVVHSELAAQSFLGAGIPAEKILVAHNGYAPKRLLPRLTRERARAALLLPRNQPIVTYAGHISISKGLGVVLDMAERLPHVIFLLVGSTKRRGRVERRARKISNVSVVSWQPVDRVVPYLYAADALLIPPTRKPLEQAGHTVLPMKTFLYLAAGRAILAPSTADLIEVLRDGHNAVLVRPDDIDDSVEGLRALLSDRARSEAMGRVAHHDSLGNTWEARAQRIVTFLHHDRRGCVSEGKQ